MTSRFALLALSLTVISIRVSVSTTAAQTVTTNQPVVPCENEMMSGKPTLKRRLADGTVENGNEVKIKPDKCKPENSEKAASEQTVTLNFEGLINTDQEELRKYLKGRRADRTGELAGNISYFENTSQLIKGFLVLHGYRHAVVTGRVDQSGANPRTATFVINEGSRPAIAEYRFQGNKHFTTLELAGRMRACMIRYETDHYNTQVFDYCKHLLANYVRSKGYLKDEFGEEKVDEIGDALIISIPVSEGVIYRVGETRIEGSWLFSPEDLREMFPLRKGEVADGEKLSNWLYDELKKLYGEKGYIQYTAEVTPEFKLAKNRSEGILDLEITIDEGQRFKVRKIKFIGERLPDNLESMMLIHDGDVYTQSLFEKSIDMLNDSGLFEFIDKDKDSDFRSNEEESLIDITIKLTRK